MTTKKAKKKAKKLKKLPPLKNWLAEQGITQRELRERTAFGTGTTNRLVNKGEASESVIRHLALELGLSLEEMKRLLRLP